MLDVLTYVLELPLLVLKKITLYSIYIPNVGTLSITLADLLENPFENKNCFFNLSNNQKAKIFIEKLNANISKHEKLYFFLYDTIEKYYPKKYFVVCVENSCSYVFLTKRKIVTVDNISVKNPMIICFSENSAKKMIKIMEKDDKDKELANEVKNMLVKGEIKLKNIETIIKSYLDKKLK